MIEIHKRCEVSFLFWQSDYNLGYKLQLKGIDTTKLESY